MATAMAVKAKTGMDDLRRQAADAEAAREQAHAALAKSQARLARIRTVLDRNIGGVTDAPTPSLEEVLTARATLTATEVEVAERQLAAMRAARVAQLAETSVKEAIRASYEPKLRAAAQDAAVAAQRAMAAMGAYRDVFMEAHEAIGETVLDYLPLQVLLPPTRGVESLVHEWIRRMQERGFVTDIE